MFQSIDLHQLYITADEDLWIKTSCTLVKLLLCSTLTNLPPSSCKFLEIKASQKLEAVGSGSDD